MDKGNPTIRQREIVINRTTALCGSEYERGVHVAAFAEQADLSPGQVRSTASASAQDSCWSQEDGLLIRLCDSLHQSCDVDEGLWSALSANFTETALIELLMLADFYRIIGYLTNGLRMPLETMGLASLFDLTR